MPPLAPAARNSKLPLKKERSPKAEVIPQPVMSLVPAVRNLATLSSPSFMPTNTAALCASERIFELEGLAGADTYGGEFGTDVFGFRIQRDELEGCVEILEEVVLDSGVVGGKKIDLRWGRRRGLLEKRGERLDLISILHLDHVRHVCRT